MSPLSPHLTLFHHLQPHISLAVSCRKVFVTCAAARLFSSEANLRAGFASAFVLGADQHSHQQHRCNTLPTTQCRPTARFMSTDEVEAAKQAAVEQSQHTSSDTDGAGPATVFDKILSGEWSSDKVFEDDKCLGFRDINPQAPTHIVLIPKERDGLTQLSKADESRHKEILGHLLFVAQEIGKEQCPKGFRVVINDGEQGAQSVYHLHVHILGGRQLLWPPG